MDEHNASSTQNERRPNKRHRANSEERVHTVSVAQDDIGPPYTQETINEPIPVSLHQENDEDQQEDYQSPRESPNVQKKRDYLRTMLTMNPSMKLPNKKNLNIMGKIHTMSESELDTIMVSAKSQMGELLNEGFADGIYKSISTVIPVPTKEKLYQDLKSDSVLHDTMKFWISFKILSLPEELRIGLLMGGHIFEHLYYKWMGVQPIETISTQLESPVIQESVINQHQEDEEEEEELINNKQ